MKILQYTIFAAWLIAILLVSGCDTFEGITATQQAEQINSCTESGMLWKHRRSTWDGEVLAIECHQPDIYNIAKEQISYDRCIASNIKYVFTDMEITNLEIFCSSESLQQGKKQYQPLEELSVVP